ncbi:MAG: FMN-binding negative transcriptional regulator [Xanthomonadaceae bacterium]|nr:FMN-binding negative transcriptional regulator [Xanthomonadaceae bacterium]
MYDLPYHKEHDAEVIKQFILQHPFALLTGCDRNGMPVASQIPLLMEERGGRMWLSGHLMKGTDHREAFESNPNVLAVFIGEHSYVSASWYSDPHLPSTWNYMSVYAKGVISFLGDAQLIDVLRKTSLHFENNDPQSPTVFDNLPEGFREKMMELIVAFEIEVTDLDTVFKLSQDRDAESYRNIIERLSLQDDNGRVISAEMKKRTGGINQ